VRGDVCKGRVRGDMCKGRVRGDVCKGSDMIYVLHIGFHQVAVVIKLVQK
jgi:hypothetical protein